MLKQNKKIKAQVQVKPFLHSQQLEVIKWLAMLTMLVDHTWRVVLEKSAALEWMMLLGRMAFPLFAFGLAYNFLFHTSDTRAYLKRLLLVGIVSQPIYGLVFDNGLLNVFFTLFLGGSVVAMCLRSQPAFNAFLEGDKSQEVKAKVFEFFLILLLLCFGCYFVEYGHAGVFLIPAFYFWLQKRDDLSRMIIPLVLLWFANSLGAEVVFTLASMVVVVWASKAHFGWSCRLPKWFNYGFYPTHLALLWALELWINF